MQARRRRAILALLASGHHDTNGMLHALKNARRHFGLMAFWRAINHPDVGTVAAQFHPHLLKPRTVQEACDSDVSDNATSVIRRLASRLKQVRRKYFPRRPPPEEHVEVLQMFGMRPLPPFGRQVPVAHR
jgi:hypothetical protein